jgi:hypothetical protein
VFRSPWQQNLYVRWVAVLRRLLHPLPAWEERFVEALVRRQNRRVHRHLAQRPARTVLLIMPRCVGRRGCCPDAARDLSASLDCRACPLGDVARLCQAHGVRALVAFRSHIAYELARREKPDLIIATACHDRLVKALRSVPEVPALLAPLAGMEKMCVNADIDLPWLEEQLRGVATKPSPTAAPRTDPVGAP